MNNHQPKPGIKLIGAFLVALAVSGFVFFWDLGVSAIANADEGVHALVTREIRERPDWLTLHIRGEEYFRKPPLAFWVRAATQLALGENEFSTRLPSALAGVATTLLLAAWAWQWTRRWTAVGAVGVIFPMLPSTFVHTFRTGETDGLLLFLLTLTAYFLWRSRERPGLVIAAGATTGLAFLTKSVAAGVIPITFGLALLLQRRWPYTAKQTWLAMAVFFAVAAPWHVVESVRHGSDFWGEYFGYHVIERVEERLHVTPKSHGPFWYLNAVQSGMYPWAWLVLPAVGFAAARWRRRDDAWTDTFVLTWGVATVVLFSLAETKLAWYIAPAFPAFTLLIARWLTSDRSRWALWLRGLVVVGLGGYAYITTRDYSTGFAGVASLSWMPWSAVVGIFLVAGAWAMSDRRWSRLAAILLLAHVVLFSGVVVSRNLRSHYESPFRILRNAIVELDARGSVYVFPIGYVTSPLSAMYLEGPNHQRQVIPLREDRVTLGQILHSKAGSFLITDVEHPLESDQIDLILASGDLRLYRIK